MTPVPDASAAHTAPTAPEILTAPWLKATPTAPPKASPTTATARWQESTHYYPNGAIETVMPHRNDEIYDIVKHYYPNGTLEYEIPFCSQPRGAAKKNGGTVERRLVRGVARITARSVRCERRKMLADMRVDEIEAVVVARVPVNPDFTAGDAIGDGRLKQFGAGFVARMVVVLPYPVTKKTPWRAVFCLSRGSYLIRPGRAW